VFSGVDKGGQPPILQTKHKHTFKLREICQFGQFILKLKSTKFDFGWGSAPDPTAVAHSAPQTL